MENQDDYFYYEGKGSIRIFYCQKNSKNWKEKFKHRSKLLETIVSGWQFTPPKFNWTVEKFSDFADWHRVLGNRGFAMSPEIAIEIKYDQLTVLDDVFRVCAPGRTVEECCQIYGKFLSEIIEKIPSPGQKYECFSMPCYVDERTRIFWLGIILQASRMCRK